MRTLILLILAASCSWGATCHLVATGNWNNANTWASSSGGTAGTCAGTSNIPGAGDAVVMPAAQSYVLTIPAGYTAIAGDDTSGNTAILRNGGVFACTKIVIADGGTLELRGHYYSDCYTSVDTSAPILTMQGAATVRFNGSFAYKIAPGSNGGNINQNFVLTGQTSAKHARFESTGSVGGSINQSGLADCTVCMGFSDGAGGFAKYVDFAGLGSASVFGWRHHPGNGFVSKLQYFTVTDCGTFGTDTAIGATSVLQWRNGTFLWGKDSTYDIKLALSTAATTGVRELTDVAVLTAGTGGTLWLNGGRDLTMTRVMVQHFDMNINNGAWTAGNDILVRKVNEFSFVEGGPFTGLHIGAIGTGANTHFVQATATLGTTIADYVAEVLVPVAGGGDSGDGWLSPSSDPGSPTSWSVSNFLMLPGPDGKSAMQFTLNGSAARTYRIAIDHASVFSGSANGPRYMLSMNENGGGMTAAQITLYKNSFTKGTGTDSVKAGLGNATSVATDLLPLAATDCNAGYGTATVNFGTAYTNAGVGYSTPFSVQAGTAGGVGEHDIDVLYPTWPGPRVVDEGRSMAFFDRDYLGNTGVAAWATATAYTKGTVISHHDASWWGDRTINFVALTDHTSGSSTAPLTGADWRANWTYAVFYRVAMAMQAESTWTMPFYGALQPIPALRKWVQLGHMPQNPVTWQNYCGTYTGAVDPAPLRRVAGALSIQ